MIPKRKQIESKMFDFPLPFRPVIALNNGSNPDITVLCAYDLNPSIVTCLMYIFTNEILVKLCHRNDFLVLAPKIGSVP